MTVITSPNPTRLVDARLRYRQFIDECKDADGLFRLTPNADSSSYALCFAIFGYCLLQAHDVLVVNRAAWDKKLRYCLSEYKELREQRTSLLSDKPYLQLLTFTLSALSILGTLDTNPIVDEVIAVLPVSIDAALLHAEALKGAPRSGNQAMFLAILLIYSRDFLGLDTQKDIDRWVSLHRDAINRFGFWGSSTTASFLQFQNGYHQYEVLKYLGSDNIPWETAASSVALLADDEGHFAPYPGGGGCYDYDAVFILTSNSEISHRYGKQLMRTAESILKDQNTDGGFCESRLIRPRSLRNLILGISRALGCTGRARSESLRYSLTLLRQKHDRIHTHWSIYSRGWSESNLWDSWFRMLALARIDSALNPENTAGWGFISFPGIGFHS